MIIVPLGVASATPTLTRHLPSVALWREGSVFLFDCGENAQMRMLQAGLKRSKIEAIFISHFDVDHYSGLIGLLATFQLQRREKSLHLIGPEGLKTYVEWNLKFAGIETSFTIEFTEVDEKFEHAIVLDQEDYFVEARPLEHNNFCIGYRFQEKDKPGKVDADKAKELGVIEDLHFKALKAGDDVTLDDGTLVESSMIVGHPRIGDSFAYITDTEYSANSVKLAMNANILYHEATFGENLEEKANTKGHSTAKDAARVANEAKAKLLVIGHFSARYTNPFVLLREAREDFYPTWLASELRPIFTDPLHEKGIIQPKVYLKEVSEENSKPAPRDHRQSGRTFRGRRTSSDRGSFDNRRRPETRHNGYRTHDRYDQRENGYRSQDRYEQREDGYRSQDRYEQREDRGVRYENRYDGNSRYQNRERDSFYTKRTYGSSQPSNRSNHDPNNQDENSIRGTKHITPRPRYDDYDRF